MLSAPYDSRLLRQRVRLGLLTGLGVLLALLVGLGLYAAHTLNGLSLSESSEIREYLLRSEHIMTARRLLTAASSAVDEYLLERDPSALSGHRDRARNSWSEALLAVRTYKQVASPDRFVLVETLDSQLSRYWARANAALALEGEQRLDVEVHSLLDELITMRNDFLATVDDVVSLDRAQLESQAATTAQVVSRSEYRLWIAIAVASLLALSVTAATFRHVTGLERIAALRHEESLKAGAELERLSRRLLTVQEEERKAIARELHDDFGQRIACLLVELSFAAGRSDVSSDLRLAIEAMADSLRNLAQDLQKMSRGLHSAVLDNIGLEGAIQADCEGLLRRSGLSVDFDATGIPRHLPVHMALALYRVFQEALKNALDHSQSDRLKVTLRAEGSEIVLRVQDFGFGFDTRSNKESGGLGLVSMRERILMVGGTFAIHSAPGRGTQVEARLRLP